jgi:hypothetical protein
MRLRARHLISDSSAANLTALQCPLHWTLDPDITFYRELGKFVNASSVAAMVIAVPCAKLDRSQKIGQFAGYGGFSGGFPNLTEYLFCRFVILKC